MCGIAGFLSLQGQDLPADAQQIIARMTVSLSHRGPDADGVWLQAGIALGHRRLSIRDLSPNGAQPMISSCGRYVLIYNGEIYNSRELAELAAAKSAVAWRGHSDTEVFLEACAALGVERAVSASIGMFAFALWDRQERVLTLGRDRLGVKPLYWAKAGPWLLFASELKALRYHPAFAADISRDALTAFMRYCFIPDPWSIYNNVYKLRPGHLLTARAGEEIRDVSYWDPWRTAQAGINNRVDNPQQALEELHWLLKDAVARRMAADVPLGAFLSGGIDSSLVAAIMQEASSQAVRTFAIGFTEREYNEAPHARAVAAFLGTRHTELYVTPSQAMAVIPKLPHMFDEPFADVSQIPTYLVSALTREHVAVALSGDGGDELFGGYPRYFRQLAGRGAAYHDACMQHWQGPEPLVLGGNLPAHQYDDREIDAIFRDDVELRQVLDSKYFLPSDILVKVDRASMAVSLEVRPPLLDHRVFAYAWRLPPSLRRAQGIQKYPLRRLLEQYVPPRLTDRPKMGFGVPIDHWLRGPLRPWAESLLAADRIRRQGFLNHALIDRVWREFLAGAHRQYWLWDVLMFQSWLEVSSDFRAQ